jgi:hypothetical protein
MKALRLALFTAMLLASADAFGQGQFFFNNYVPPEINARFILNTDPLNGSSSSIAWGWQIYVYDGPPGTPLNLLSPAQLLRPPSEQRVSRLMATSIPLP